MTQSHSGFGLYSDSKSKNECTGCVVFAFYQADEAFLMCGKAEVFNLIFVYKMKRMLHVHSLSNV